VLAELARLLDELDAQPPKGLVFRSLKSSGFIAGANIGSSRLSILPTMAAAPN
jgi:enoyl-CoA hydratase/carnithine racemase